MNNEDTKHTPGPWRVTNIKDGAIDVWTTAEQHGTICRIPKGEKGMGPYGPSRPTGTYGSIVDPCEREANARLIAAAPETLAELDAAQAALDRAASFVADLAGWADDPMGADAEAEELAEQASKARAAIAKAEGRDV